MTSYPMLGPRTVRSAITAFAAAAALAVMALVFLLATGRVVLLEVTSGSMQPAMSTGDMLITRKVDATDLQVGDVVTVPTGDGGLLTHRVVDIEPGSTPAARTLSLKGDANQTDDAQVFEVGTALEMVATLPRAGHLRAALADPPTPYLFAGGGVLLAAGAVVWNRRAQLDDDAGKLDPDYAPDDAPEPADHTIDIPLPAPHIVEATAEEAARREELQVMRLLAETVRDIPLPPWAPIGMTAMANQLGLPGPGDGEEFSADGRALAAAISSSRSVS